MTPMLDIVFIVDLLIGPRSFLTKLVLDMDPAASRHGKTSLTNDPPPAITFTSIETAMFG